jgi:ATP-binding cassette, subfamily B (MDR/TAP), member 1
MAIVYAATSMSQIGPQAMVIGQAASAADDLFKVIDREPQIDSLTPKGMRPDKCNGDVDIRDIHFAYPSRPNATVLKGFSLSIPAGKTTALVGASGSGKSTIVGLLERWYDPAQGSLSIDGVDIRELNVQWLRTKIRMVQQVCQVLSETESVSDHTPGTRVV